MMAIELRICSTELEEDRVVDTLCKGQVLWETKESSGKEWMLFGGRGCNMTDIICCSTDKFSPTFTIKNVVLFASFVGTCTCSRFTGHCQEVILAVGNH